MPARAPWTLFPLGLVAAACSRPDPQPAATAPPAVLLGSAAAAASPVAGLAAAPAAPPEPTPTGVGLDGVLHPTALVAGRRVYARSLKSWIYERPTRTAERLGYFRAGSSLTLRGERVGSEGCAAGWFGVRPRGFVCAEGAATLDENDAVVAAYRGLC